MTESTKKYTFSCPLCPKNLEIRTDRKSKPYCICDDCGIQLFIRGREGINRLERITGWKDDSFEKLLRRHEQEKYIVLKEELRRLDQAIKNDIFENHPGLRERREEICREIRSLEK